MVASQTIQMTTMTVAMVEDDPDVALLVEEMLPGVHHFETGEAAVEALRASSEQPRYILLDLELPSMGGLEVLRRLRADRATRRTPVVVFTGTDIDPDMGYRMGANAWVRKPSDADELLAAVMQIDAFWGTWNEPRH